MVQEKYGVQLATEEQNRLRQLVKTGRRSARMIARLVTSRRLLPWSAMSKLRRITASAGVGRSHFAHRADVVFRDAAELRTLTEADDEVENPASRMAAVDERGRGVWRRGAEHYSGQRSAPSTERTGKGC